MPALDRNDRFTLGVILAVTALAALLRTPQLERRPFHNDEANQAWKAGILLDTGVYRYDPHEHHGPTLYYLTLPLAWLQSGGSFAATEIWVYRAVPAVFGVLLVLLAWCAREALGRGGAAAAALFTAVSPAMVYYSRFYIQELLLVTFSFALLLAAWRYWRKPSAGAALCLGISAGLMHATKETCVLSWAALGGTVAVHLLLRQCGQRTAMLQRPGWRHLALAAGSAGVVSILFFSSFLTHWRGPLDSLLTYASYLDRGANAGVFHRHPFHFYLGILTFSRPAPGLTWGEDMILGLGLVATIVAWIWPGRLQSQAQAIRLLSVYGVLLTLIYSAIPYKTTWCLLSFWHAWILLAGVGAVALTMLPRWRWQRILVALALAAGAAQLAQRAWLAASRYPTSQRNPYAYAQTGPDFLRLVDRINALSATAAEAQALRIHVIAPPDQTWPLPWYLRRFTRVGYWTAPVPEALAAEPAVLITSPEVVNDLPEDMRRHYVTEYYGLRPEVLLALHIRADLWDRFLRSRAAPTTRPATAKES